MIPLAALTVAGCLAVGPASDRDCGRRSGSSIPGLTTSAPEESVAFAPAPGVLRVFHVPELRRWRYDSIGRRALGRRLRRTSGISARFRTAAGSDAPDFAGGRDRPSWTTARQPLPAGEIEFPAAGLRSSAAGALWIGAVHYAGTRRLTVWARVKVAVTASRVLAAVDLRPGEAVNAAQLRVETAKCFRLPAILQSVDDVVGKWPRTTIRAGTALRADMLHLPSRIARGDTIAGGSPQRRGAPRTGSACGGPWFDRTR